MGVGIRGLLKETTRHNQRIKLFLTSTTIRDYKLSEPNSAIKDWWAGLFDGHFSMLPLMILAERGLTLDNGYQLL